MSHDRLAAATIPAIYLYLSAGLDQLTAICEQDIERRTSAIQAED